MADFLFNGVTYKIPGVYATTKVQNQAGAIPPEFNIALIIGDASRGQPYDYTTVTPVKEFERQGDVNDEYGSTSDIAQAFEYFKKHGGRKAYCLCASNSTKGTGSLSSAAPAAVIDLTAANWGSYSAGIKITVENNTTYVIITITDPDDTGVKVVSGQLTTLDLAVAWINANASKYFAAVKSSGASDLPADFDGLFSTTTAYAAGTDPAPTTDDYDNIITALPDWISEYDIRLICVVCSLASADQHAVYQSFRDLAISQRTAGKPIQIICGGNTGDIVPGAGDTTAPEFRAGIYNSQDVMLVSPGIDSLAPYVSSAPAVLGLLNGNNIAHNLTRDTIVAATLEKKYTTSQLETLIDGGVIVFSFDKAIFRVAKGVNTLQANDATWNVAGKTTYLPMQRSICDYILKYFKEDLESFIGADGILKNQIASRCAYNWDVLKNSFDPSLFGENSDDVFGNGLPYLTEKITAVAEGWQVYIALVPATETNYIGLTVQVIVSY